MSNYNYKYKCTVCNNENIIKFENMVNLYYIKCSKCYNQSELIERTKEKEQFIYTFITKKQRFKNGKIKCGDRKFIKHYNIKRA